MKKISNKVVSLLKKKKLKISLAESCTGGLLSSKLTKLSGSSKYFRMGLITRRLFRDFNKQFTIFKIKIIKLPLLTLLL